LDDHHLDEPPPLFSPWFWLLLVWQAVSVFLLLPPLLVIGYVINLPTALLISAGAELSGREEKDVASRKLLGGVLLFPLTWGLWGWLAAAAGDRFGSLAPWLPQSAALAGLSTVLLGMAGAVVMVVYVGLARSTWRALRVRLTRGRRTRAFLRLKVERGRLYEELLALADGLELPGVVGADGRVSRAVP
jgi:hypothetical protein